MASSPRNLVELAPLVGVEVAPWLSRRLAVLVLVNPVVTARAKRTPRGANDLDRVATPLELSLDLGPGELVELDEGQGYSSIERSTLTSHWSTEARVPGVSPGSIAWNTAYIASPRLGCLDPNR